MGSASQNNPPPRSRLTFPPPLSPPTDEEMPCDRLGLSRLPCAGEETVIRAREKHPCHDTILTRLCTLTPLTWVLPIRFGRREGKALKAHSLSGLADAPFRRTSLSSHQRYALQAHTTVYYDRCSGRWLIVSQTRKLAHDLPPSSQSAKTVRLQWSFDLPFRFLS